MIADNYTTPALERIMYDLQLSGIQFSIKYIGSMFVETSIRSIQQDKWDQFAQEAIAKVCAEADRLRSLNETRIQKHKCATSELFDIFDEPMDVNIASHTISLLQYVDFGVRVIASFPLPDISLFSQGVDAHLSHFCFFAHFHDEREKRFRRCFVFDATPCAAEMMEAFQFAMKVYEIDRAAKEREAMEDEQTPLNNMPTLKLDGEDIEMTDETQSRRHASSPTHRSPSATPSASRRTSVSPMRAGHSSSSRMNQLYASVEQMQGRGRKRERSSSRHRSTSSQRCAMEDERVANVWNQPWFHGVLERTKAEALVQRPGQFLVRVSPNGENQFVLTGLSKDDGYYHVALMEEDGRMCLGNTFKTIVGFIYYCQQHAEFLPQHDVNMCLTEEIRATKSFLVDDEDN